MLETQNTEGHRGLLHHLSKRATPVVTNQSQASLAESTIEDEAQLQPGRFNSFGELSPITIRKQGTLKYHEEPADHRVICIASC